MHPATLAVHAGRCIDPASGAVAAAIQLSTIFARDEAGQGIGGYEYGRDGNPGRAALEHCLATLEQGTACIAFGSGMAAIAASVECLPDHLPRRLLLAEDMYWGLQAMLEATPLHRSFSVRRVDTTDLAALHAACAEFRPGLVWLETPSNPLLRITDITAAAAIAHAAGALVAADNTFATPLLQNPLSEGADLVVQSATKYIGGGSDLTLGAVILRQEGPYARAVRATQQVKGAIPSPFDCWLALRGLATLPARLRAHCDGAMAVARYCAAHPAIAAVHYPGLPDHPNHALAAARMAGFGGMMSIVVHEGIMHGGVLHGADGAARATAARLRLFTRATSFGDAHSLVEYRPPAPPRALPAGLLRLSIGLEHPQDLIDDLDQALGHR